MANSKCDSFKNMAILAVPLEKKKEKGYEYRVWSLGVFFGQHMFGRGGK